MAAVREKIRLVSTGTKKDGVKTGHFYTTTKNRRLKPEKMSIMKFDPRAWNEKTGHQGMHVLYKEEKIK